MLRNEHTSFMVRSFWWAWIQCSCTVVQFSLCFLFFTVFFLLPFIPLIPSSTSTCHTFRTHFSPPNLGGNGVVSCSLNAVYLARWGERGQRWSRVFFPYFPPLKPRNLLWSSVSYSPKPTALLFPSPNHRTVVPVYEFFFFLAWSIYPPPPHTHAELSACSLSMSLTLVCLLVQFAH